MRVAIAQLDITIGAFAETGRKMSAAIHSAREAEADLLVFSELSTTGYPPRDLLLRPGFVDQNLALLAEVAAQSDDRLGILVGYVEPNPSEGKHFYNSVALCHGGRVVGNVRKMLLPTYDVFDEGRYFEEAEDNHPLVLHGVPLGVTICEDLWNDRDQFPRRLYHRDPVDEMVEKGARLLINLSASPFDLGKARVRRELVRHKAVKHGRCFVYCNQVGAQDELIFDGHSLVVDPTGRTVVRAREFREDLLVWDVPAETLEDQPRAIPCQPGLLRDVATQEEELARQALVMGLRDYAARCGFTRAVVALSGGIDSALVAVLAAEALGPENVLTVAMPTRYSSDHSLRDAADLARNLGVHHIVVPIEGLFEGYLRELGPVLGGPPDVTEENLQARIRANVVMALSNKQGRLLLTTGNKSELAVGYCTMYGDMCGGLAVISDVLKTFVYRLCRHINAGGEIIPASTLTKAPSAELRPGQKDQDSLPPYEVLDLIVAGYVEEGLGVDGLVAQGLDRGVVEETIRRIDLAEYKRWQAAPGLRITARAFGSGRRFPISADWRGLNGGGSRG